MKHMWKKNQIIITALAALVAVAGYLNYSGTKLGENALPASTTETEATLTDIDRPGSGHHPYRLGGRRSLFRRSCGRRNRWYERCLPVGGRNRCRNGHCIRRSDRHAGRGSTYQHRNRQQLCGPRQN